MAKNGQHITDHLIDLMGQEADQDDGDNCQKGDQQSADDRVLIERVSLHDWFC